jgi:hypothetical protein
MPAGQVSDPGTRASLLPGDTNLLFTDTLPSQSIFTLDRTRRYLCSRPVSTLNRFSVGLTQPISRFECIHHE